VGLYLHPPENAVWCVWMRNRTSKCWNGRRVGCGRPTERP
jgi:hypothetical protein